MKLIAGGGTKIINCEIGDGISGQLHNRICKKILDDLEANAFYISGGKESILIISCDLVGLHRDFILGVTFEIEKKTRIQAKNILICCTHTHTGPYTKQSLFDVPRNDRYIANLKNWLIELAQETVKSAKPAKVGWNLGKAHVGYNRRTCWQDGSHLMYGDMSKPGFTGLEGSDDPSHAILFAIDENKEIIALVHNNCSHATCVENAEFASADFPGQARRFLRDAVGSKIPVLYLQGASGDISPWNMLQHQRVSGERRAREMGSLLAGETLKLVYGAEMSDSTVIKSEYEELKLNIRLPGARELEEAKRIVNMGVEKAGRWDYVLKESVLRLNEKFKDNPVEKIPVHTIRLGKLAIATNPFEYYCQFGLDIKRRSPAKVTMVAQLTNGASGYCPTIYGIIGGGYSGMIIYWTRFEPYAGYKIVDLSAKLLYKLWK